MNGSSPRFPVPFPYLGLKLFPPSFPSINQSTDGLNPAYYHYQLHTPNPQDVAFYSIHLSILTPTLLLESHPYLRDSIVPLVMFGYRPGYVVWSGDEWGSCRVEAVVWCAGAEWDGIGWGWDGMRLWMLCCSWLGWKRLQGERSWSHILGTFCFFFLCQQRWKILLNPDFWFFLSQLSLARLYTGRINDCSFVQRKRLT